MRPRMLSASGLVFNHEVSHWNRPGPYRRPYEEHYYKRRNVFRFLGYWSHAVQLPEYRVWIE